MGENALSPICDEAKWASFEPYTMSTRSGAEFTSVVVICAEAGDENLIAKMEPVDLLSYPAGNATFLSGDETLKRFQFFESPEISPWAYHIYGGSHLDSFVDYAPPERVREPCPR